MSLKSLLDYQLAFVTPGISPLEAISLKQKGPVEFIDMQVAWHDGLLKSDSYIWREGMGEWKKISDIAGLQVQLQSSKLEHEE